MGKIFLVNQYQNAVSASELQALEQDRSLISKRISKERESKSKDMISVKDSLVFIKGRVIVKVNLEAKNSHTFTSGEKIRLERAYNNFNRRETQPVNAIVISAEHIPDGAEILIGHNSLHETNRIYNYTPLSGTIDSSDVKYYSLPEEDCFAWRDENEDLHPMKNFVFALRVFKPYTGLLEGVDHTKIKDVLYITTGEFKGQVVHVLMASDYEIVYQGKSGREERKIRCRHFEDDYNEKEEIIAIADDLTEKVNNNELLIGLTSSDAKPLKENVPIS